MKLGSAMLYVKDLQHMKRFYTDLLGSGPSNQDSTDTWAVLETSGARFVLHAIPAELAQDIEITSPPTAREEAPVKLIFEVSDVEAARARLKALGAQVLRRPWQKPGEAFDAVDPEGNIFQVGAAGER